MKSKALSILTVIIAVSMCLSFVACGRSNDVSGGDEMQMERIKISVIVGNNKFTATLADTEAAEEFASMLPMTLNMSELNGNEKYCYLDVSLSAAALRPGQIKSGDIMLYGSSCVVLFYKDFATSYDYTPIGTVDDPSGLAQALGNGNVTVKFSILN